MPINFRAFFLPDTRADADTFWLGLGFIAFADALRLTLLDAGLAMFAWLLILFCLAALHINRLRDAGRQGPLVIVPLAAGVAVKAIVAIIAVTVAILPGFMDYLEAQGVDINDPAQVQAAGQDDELIAGFQQLMIENEADTLAAFSAGDWPSAIAFWLTVFAIGFWFARMPRKG
ncbi:hypothetical protein X907_1275 [Glycocaulis alkaliphilus]|uniref:Uncharacterized protein n=1 Tax=Glycocaulis alkaliphilus TaxID=1434191 RepID=A0A3T0E973_9PROT|nr:hypothetical protein [Glycocaulis alkaliphilus]AZU03810.1 hypothetical protein X907_1275 [Glycocaulis alkaliphilus]GGB84091.1 hypothetical protein GCM10007417_25110 [Glycocaulis alkaliphilus]